MRQVQPDNGSEPFLLALFTSLPTSSQAVLDLYAQRWKIETDLRTLKSELRLDPLTCSTPEMAAKEIQMAIAAYNIVRAVICLASQQSALPPRGYGFNKVRRIVEIFESKIATAADEPTRQQYFDQMMYYVQQAKHPKRRHQRPSSPRQVWGNGARFPVRKR